MQNVGSSDFGRPFIGCLLLVTIGAASTLPLSATTVEFTTKDLGGLFEYDLVLTNIFNQPLSGLDILHANSVFGLNASSVINTPPGWDFFPPLPPTVDELSFFSLSDSADVPIEGSLAGFSFDSTTNPSTLTGGIAFDVIGGQSGTQIPEPGTLPLLAGGVGALLYCLTRRPRAWPLRRFRAR